MKQRHESITDERIIRAVEADDNLGFCLSCGADAQCVEPDARKYECEACGAPAVYGAQECLFMFIG
jgi:predicted RNA-binding Zn-ribbon protein involved in translation (DUF1610 family)